MLFLDGSMIPADKQTIEFLSPGILNAKGVLETMRSYQGNVFLLDQHLERLAQGLRILRIKAPCSTKKIKKYIDLSLRLNPKDARVRLMVWQKERKTHIAVMSLPYHPFSVKKYRQGFHAMMSHIRRNTPARWSWVKALQDISLFKAYQEAMNQGSDEALLLNQRGELVEGSRSNVFLVINGELWTPSLECGCLRGVTRDAVITLARRLERKVRMTRIKPDAFQKAQEAFLTNSLLEIMPLTSVNDRKIGSGKMGSLTFQLLKQYRTLIADYQFSVCSAVAHRL